MRRIYGMRHGRRAAEPAAGLQILGRILRQPARLQGYLQGTLALLRMVLGLRPELLDGLPLRGASRQRGHLLALGRLPRSGQESAGLQGDVGDAQQEGHPAGDAHDHPNHGERQLRQLRTHVRRHGQSDDHDRPRRRLSRLVRALRQPPAQRRMGVRHRRVGSRLRAGILGRTQLRNLRRSHDPVRAVSRPVHRPDVAQPRKTADRGRTHPARRDGALPRLLCETELRQQQRLLHLDVPL